MRVIAGSARGRVLRGPPRGSPTRPTPDRVREALFQILETWGAVAGARVLDLYAGTGALGIEALSRGAEHVTFVENSPQMATVIRDNLARFGALGEKGTIIVSDVREALHRPPGETAPFDLVLADPPYASGLFAPTLAGIVRLLSNEAIVVCEHSSRQEPPEAPRLIRIETRRYGDTAVSLYKP